MNPTPQPAKGLSRGRRLWLPRRQLSAGLLLGATALALYGCYRMALPFLPAITWAAAFGVIAYPVHRWLSRHVTNRDLAAASTVVLVAVLVIVPGLFVLQQLTQEAARHAARVKEQAQTGELRDAVEQVPGGTSMLAWVEANTDFDQAVREVTQRLTADVAPLLAGSVWGGVQFLTMLFLLFYFLKDGFTAVRRTEVLLPLSQNEGDRVFRDAGDAIHATIYGTFVVSIVQGVMGGLLFYFLGLPAPVFWGVIMTLLGILPYLGAFIVWVPAAVSLALAGDYFGAAVLTVWGSLMAGVVCPFLYARLVGDRLRLHTVLTFLAFVGGLAVFGLSGMILGPVLLSVAIALVKICSDHTVEESAAPAGTELIRGADRRPTAAEELEMAGAAPRG